MTKIKEVTMTGYIEGFRWAGLEKFLFNVAGQSGVKYKTIGRDRGLLNITIYYEVIGSAEKVNSFSETAQLNIDQYNKEE